jgi:Leishmanolysin
VAQGVAGSDAQNCPYLGAKATAEYRAISGCKALPTELDTLGGTGSRCSHFDEVCLQRELMTPAVNNGVQNPLSRITIASLEDLGYVVSYTQADAYRSTNLGPGCSCRRRHSRGLRPADTTANAATVTTPPRRKLSDKMRQYAIEQGREYLASQPSVPAATLTKMRNSGVRYVGDQFVTVYVLDGNGTIFDVHVTPAD